MGLDVNVYKLITDKESIDLVMKEFIEMEGYSYLDNNVLAISFYEFNLFYKNNKRMADLFVRFSDHTNQYVQKDVYDYKKLAELYGELSDLYTETRCNLSDEHMKLCQSIRGDMDDDSPHKSEYDNFAIYTNVNGNIHIMKPSDVPITNIDDSVLFFKEVNYCRKTHKPSIYNSFIGDCWYEDDKSGLSESDVRTIVYPEEMDELKQHFEEYSDVQKWNLNDDEIVYLSA